MRGDDRFFLAQISDTHVRADDGGASADLLRRALAQAREYQANVILLTGDLVNDEREAEYRVLADVLATERTPLYLQPGNHDDRDRIRAAFPNHAYLPSDGHLSFVVNDLPVRLVVVDQIVPGQTHGLFTRELATWLDAELARAPDTPTVIALHHPPFPTHDKLFDRIGLWEHELFASVVSRHRQVIRIIAGHHHRMVVGQVAHAPVVVAPSTSWVYGLAAHDNQPIAPRTQERPGWVLHAWTPTAGMASHFMQL